MEEGLEQYGRPGPYQGYGKRWWIILTKYLMMGNLILIFFRWGKKWWVFFYDKHFRMMGNLILIFCDGAKTVDFLTNIIR